MNKDEKALENFFENIATDLLSGLLDANDNEQNAHLKAWLDAPFNVVPENLLRHAELICNHFSAGENGHLLMHGIDDQLANEPFPQGTLQPYEKRDRRLRGTP